MYEDLMDVGFPGMKADAGDDRVETFPVGAAGVGFGVVVGTAADGTLVAGAGTRVRGISVHSHAVRGVVVDGDTVGYAATEACSVMTRGHIWAAATGTVTVDGPVSFGADGRVSDAGTALPNAMFRGPAISTAYGTIALVELHAPFAVAPAA